MILFLIQQVRRFILAGCVPLLLLTQLCSLRVKDLESRQGVAHLRIFGKGSKIRFLPAHPVAGRLIVEYLEDA